ncbi:MAG: Formamidopyrimidine-DNA glycosylase [Syntrophus sp. SKADARSKE-3]|nr:Formamidopyrimidine-DNA glycosylase [Syntrophus sp. SKADARSKE-3]
MPELPEVETLCRQLSTVIVGRKILAFRVLDAKLGAAPDVIDCRVKDIVRRGKEIQIVLNSGMALRIHLRMSGKLFWQTGEPLALPYSRFIVTFDVGRLILLDPRRFATLSYGSYAPAIELQNLPFQETDISRIIAIAQKRRVAVKTFLLDQTIMTGIGNIYACEILHAAAIDPERRACDLSTVEWQSIVNVTTPILTKAIEARGTTVSDWRDLFGREGENQHYLKVYAREGKPCMRCSGTVARIKQNGRGTYYCPSCQK